jgi:hypothetical protein
MRGDLSTRYRGPDVNFNGVLYQQGRVFLDRDGNAQTAITTEWEDLAGRDIIGAGLLAVPGDEPESFRIEQADLVAGEVTLTVHPGRAWADGMLVRLDETPPVTRHATQLGPPIQDPVPGAPVADDRDAVVLEVWRQEVHGFQLPDELVEPALGGVDTTERLATGMDFRLYRMDADDTCETIVDKVVDDPSTKGKLTVTLQPTVVIAGDCPTVEGGGYTGFEHSLFRIEIAATTAGPRMFKWSQFNGGLVGRGTFDAATQRATITANLAAIATSDLTDFYLELVEWDTARGVWAVTYGAKVSLVGDELVLPAAATFGAIPAAGQTVFFRLWNDIRSMSDFPVSATPTELVDGIRLEFEADAVGKYAPEDYWTFQVRAGEIGNPIPLVDNEPPEGILYHRVPVAVLEWDGTTTLSPGAGTIEDCREVFQPLTRLTTCCTYRVGDGLVSHGHFTSIQAAIDALPPEGGKVCVLPGTFLESVLIDGRRNVTVSGCGRRSHVAAPPDGGDPVVHVVNSTGITLEHLSIEADEEGVGVLLEEGAETGSGGGGEDVPTAGVLDEIVLADLLVRAVRRSGIECHDGRDVVIRNCVVWMQDRRSTWPGIFLIAHDARVEDNTVLVVGREGPPSPGDVFTAGGGLGGIQLGGGCERVMVLDNLVQGGVGNGITLGSVRVIDPRGGEEVIGWVVDRDDECFPCRPGDLEVPPDDEGDGPRFISDGPLRDILIADNRILDMGLNGIGVIGFFDLKRVGQVVSVHGLRIVENEIRRCLQRALAPIRRDFADTLGYGGIALADASFLEIRENIIEDNGPDHLEPICGIFLLHGEGVEITENRIYNNGAKTNEPASAAKPGPRGGIYIAACTPALLDLTGGRQLYAVRAANWRREGDLGAAALRVHDNRVTAPLGRALTATTIGDVSIHGNHFTSLGVEPHEGRAFLAAATVQLRDLGRSPFLGGAAAYTSVKRGMYVAMPTESIGTGFHERPTDAAVLERLGGNARILFTDNQVALRVHEEQHVSTLASIFVLSLSDVGFHNNECTVDLLEGGVITNAFVFGFSVRMTDSRLDEGLPNALFSGITLGVMNMTTDNQATHCLLIRGWGAALTVRQPNTVFVAALQPAFCERLERLLGAFGTTIGKVAEHNG